MVAVDISSFVKPALIPAPEPFNSGDRFSQLAR